PRRSFNYGGRSATNSREQIIISAAGPVAQILLAAVIGFCFFAAGFVVPNPLPFFNWPDYFNLQGRVPSDGVRAFERAIIDCSVIWALLNLLPVYPLDGGQIALSAFMLKQPREAIRYSLILSVVTGGIVAAWAFLVLKDTFMGLMFASLAYSSYATLQSYFGG